MPNLSATTTNLPTPQTASTPKPKTKSSSGIRNLPKHVELAYTMIESWKSVRDHSDDSNYNSNFVDVDFQ